MADNEMTDNEKLANRAHDDLAAIIDKARKNPYLNSLTRDLNKIYDDMSPLFSDILRR